MRRAWIASALASGALAGGPAIAAVEDVKPIEAPSVQTIAAGPASVQIPALGVGVVLMRGTPSPPLGERVGVRGAAGAPPIAPAAGPAPVLAPAGSRAAPKEIRRLGETLRSVEAKGDAAPALEAVFDEADWKNEAYWRAYANEVHEAMVENLTRMRPAFLAAKAAGHGHVRFLEEAGVRFEPELYVPPIDRILDHYNARMDRLIEAGTVRPEEVIRPARAFATREGKMIHLPFGTSVPEGVKPKRGLLGDGEIHDMIAAGWYPISDHEKTVAEDQEATLLHDLAHFSAFAEAPAFMASLRRAVAALRRDGGPAWRHEDVRANVYQRLFYILEYLSVIPKAKRKELRRLLPLPATKDGSRTPGVQAVRAHLASLPPEDVARYIEVLRREVPKLILHLGGGVRDVIIPAVVKEDARRTGYDRSLNYRWQRATSTLPTLDPKAWDYRERLDALAWLSVRLLESTFIDPGELPEQALRIKVKRGSSLASWLEVFGGPGASGLPYPPAALGGALGLLLGLYAACMVPSTAAAIAVLIGCVFSGVLLGAIFSRRDA